MKKLQICINFRDSVILQKQVIETCGVRQGRNLIHLSNISFQIFNIYVVMKPQTVNVKIRSQEYNFFVLLEGGRWNFVYKSQVLKLLFYFRIFGAKHITSLSLTELVLHVTYNL